MPVFQQYHTATIKAAHLDECSLVICSVGVHIMGSFPMAIRQLKFLVVGIDYFTKRVEAEPLVTITEKKRSKLLLEKHHLPLWNPHGLHL